LDWSSKERVGERQQIGGNDTYVHIYICGDALLICMSRPNLRFEDGNDFAETFEGNQYDRNQKASRYNFIIEIYENTLAFAVFARQPTNKAPGLHSLHQSEEKKSVGVVIKYYNAF
jgi:hypothetical protein